MAESTSIELKPEERTECEVWSRVMGYHRPVSAYNKGKQQEHRDRRFFREGLRCAKLPHSMPVSGCDMRVSGAGVAHLLE